MSKKGKVLLSIITMIFGISTACIGFGLIDSIASFSVRFICGLFFIGTPIMIIALINLLFRK
ncbi:MAG: hypothetical protein RR621_05345 [Lachnospiraceae bacterium]